MTAQQIPFGTPGCTLCTYMCIWGYIDPVLVNFMWESFSSLLNIDCNSNKAGRRAKWIEIEYHIYT